MFNPLPERLMLKDAQADAWILPGCSSLPESLLSGLLSPDELDKGRRFHFQKDRDLSFNARVVLRVVLGKYLGIPAGEIQFVYTSRGRPVLAPEQAAGGIEFSVSHSFDRIAIAVARGPIGIDLEQAGREVDLNLLSSYLSLPEVPAERRQAEFLRHWTRMEAYLKATGEGLDNVPAPAPDPSWVFFDLSDEEYTLAIAAPPPCVRCRPHSLQWAGSELAAQQREPVFPDE
jgi:phosphopantetheinyl transferase